jgi:uncharacterized protein (TIGR02594 family)
MSATLSSPPLWRRVAEAQLGVREVPGAKSNPRILSWARKVGGRLGIAFTDDATPWCGLFVAYCMTAAGIAPPPIAVRAKAWASWGEPLEVATDGAVLVFERPGGGHVGLYAGETGQAYHVLGGNQGDAVSFAWIAKARCIAIRWPTGEPRPARPVRIVGAKAPAVLSTDEA